MSQDLPTRLQRRSISLLRVAIVAVSVVPTVVYLVVAVRRLGYPYELEWLEGGAVEIVGRVAHGQPLYVAPSMHYVPYPYTPLYFWISGALARVVGVGFVPLRVVSLLSSLGSCAVLLRIVWRETGDLVAGVLATGLFTATFAVSGAWFDIGRVDSLALFLILLSMAAARRATRVRSGALVGVLVFVAFLAKQSALVTAAPIVLLLILVRRRVGLAALGVAAGLILLSTVLLDAVSHGWYRYYVFQELAGQGVESSAAATFFTVDLLHVVLAIAMGIVGFVMRTRRRGDGATDWRFWGVSSGGLVLAALVARLHSGGGPDTLMPAFAGVALLGGLGYDSLRGRATTWAGSGSQRQTWGWAPVAVAAVLTLVVTAQLATLRYRPGTYVPTATDERAGDAFIAELRATPGSVLVTDHPYYATLAGKEAWAQGEAVHDLLRAGPGRARDELVASIDSFLRSSRPTTIFSDSPDTALDGYADTIYALAATPVFGCDACFFPVTDLRRRPGFRFERRPPA